MSGAELPNLAEVQETPEVRRWLEKSGYHALPEVERRRYVAQVAQFCTYTGKSPGELVRSCLLVKDGLTKISIRGRRAMQEAIDDFVAEAGLEGRDAIVAGNRIRGFLVHNGIFIQGRASIS
ncbi:MAG: hypothetical protein ACJ768_21265 [Gaiellaceae bacterium]